MFPKCNCRPSGRVRSLKRNLWIRVASRMAGDNKKALVLRKGNRAINLNLDWAKSPADPKGVATVTQDLIIRGRESTATLGSLGRAAPILDRAVRMLTLMPGILRHVPPGIKMARVPPLRILRRYPRIS